MDKPLPCIAEIPTLLGAQGEVDLHALRGLQDRLRSAGYQQILILGLTGEYTGLTIAGQEAFLCEMLSGAGDLRVMCGALDAGTEKVALRIRAQRALGCEAHLVLPAYFFGLSNGEEILRHVRLLLREGSRLMLADSPAHTGYSVPEEILPELLALPGLEALLCSRPPHSMGMPVAPVPVYTGDEALLLDMRGAGVVSRLAFLFPGLVLRLLHGGKVPQAVRAAMLYLLDARAHTAAVLKYAAWQMGLCESPEVFAPAAALGEKARRDIQEAVRVIAQEEEGCAHD